MKKKIAILISGQIRIYKENLDFLKKIFSEFDYEIFAALWENQNETEEFCNLYQIKNIKKIQQKNWEDKIGKIQYVFGEENRSYQLVNIFHMWHSISENVKFLDEQFKIYNADYDYVCRFRTDLFSNKIPNNIQTQILKLKNNEIIFPENLHSRGLNDLFFICNFRTFLEFKNVMYYLDKFIEEKRPLSSEYFLYHFVKKNSLKIKIINNLLIDIFDVKNKSHKNYELKPTKKAYIPLKDKVSLKYIKYKIRFLKKLNN